LFDVGFFLGKMDVGLDVAGRGGELGVGGNLLFGPLALAKDTLGGLLIVPKSRVGNARFEGLQAFVVLRRVKDSSERA
jgi:hypothetical protein